MTRQDLIFVYLTRLEKAKFDLDVTERSGFLPGDPLDKTRWALEVEVRQSLVHVYDGFLKILQEPRPSTNSESARVSAPPPSEGTRSNGFE
jgi:hypothetical protein